MTTPDESSPSRPRRRPRRSWARRFSDAARGVKLAVRSELSFFVHLFMTVLVLAVGITLGLPKLQWCLVALCIAIVLTAETFNTALERLARAVTEETNPLVRDALDMASGAVLIAALGAASVGGVLLAAPLWARLFS